MVYILRFYVKTPIIAASPIHLDGLLAAVHPAMHNNGKITSRQTPVSELKTAPLPIDSIVVTENGRRKWQWCCSAGEFAESAEFFSDKFARRKTDIDYMYMKSRQTPNCGINKNFMGTIYGILTPYIEFYVSTTNKKELMRIAKRVKNIGSHREKGYGQIADFELIETNDSFQDCVIDGIYARRNLAAAFVESGAYRNIPTKPPYFHGGMIESGVVVGDRCALKEVVTLNEI